MTQSSFDENGLQFAWNSTSIKLIEECMYKYKLVMLDQWAPIELSVHLKFGSHYALALEHFYKHRALGASIDEALILILREAMIDTWEYEKDEKGARIPGTGQPWQSNDNTKTRENLIRSLVWYIEQFAEEPIEVMKLSDGSPAVEYSFALPVDDGIIFAGHLDRLVEYAHNPYVMDQKTTKSTITPKYFEGFSPDTQMSLYTFAGKAVFDMPVKGVIIDVAQIAVGFTRLDRGFVTRTDSQLNEWYDGAMHHIEQARKATREQYFPMNTTSCGNYGGCPFRSACSRSPEVREQFIKASFTQAPRWEPLRK